VGVGCRLKRADDVRVRGLVDSLLRSQWPDGGWNCDRRPEVNHSSFHESITPLWGLSEYARATGDERAAEATDRAAELFRRHRLFRSHRTGGPSRPWTSSRQSVAGMAVGGQGVSIGARPVQKAVTSRRSTGVEEGQRDGDAERPSSAPGGGQNDPVTNRRATRRRILEFALGFPGAYEDHPWDEDVVKVGKKIFVFLGVDDSKDPGMTVKLDESHEQALAVPGASPTGYGLGRAGWVTIPFRDTTPPIDVLKDWVDESFRRIAPKLLIARLEERPPRR
jgi:predicted DNA-binding protein (MmcQ/YjbR family)